MTVVRVKGFKIFKDRHGRERCYHRKTGEKIDLTKAPKGSAEFLAECARISALATAVTPKPGTLGMLIEAYRGHVGVSGSRSANSLRLSGRLQLPEADRRHAADQIRQAPGRTDQG